MDEIERTDASPWVSPIVVTLRKNGKVRMFVGYREPNKTVVMNSHPLPHGKVRMCVDYREPIKAVVMDSHPLPHMDDIFTEMRGATVFSTITWRMLIIRCYWQRRAVT